MKTNVVYRGDCLAVMQEEIADGSIDMILCDLPYGVTRNKWDEVIPFDDLWKQYKRIIKPNGAILLFADGMFMARLMVSNPAMWRYNLVWKKGERVSGFLNANKMPLRNHEEICVFYKALPTYNPQFTEGIPLHGKGNAYLTKANTNNNYGSFQNLPDARKGTTQKYPKSVLDYDKPHPAIFPTQKPVELCKYLIRTYTNENEIVLDNCCGSGTTLLAARNTNRKYIGIELNDNNYHLTMSRLWQTARPA